MALAILATQSAGVPGGSNALNINRPAVDNTLVIVFISWKGVIPFPQTGGFGGPLPTGFTILFQTSDVTLSRSIGVFYKYVTDAASEPFFGYNFLFENLNDGLPASFSGFARAIALIVTGADSSTPMEPSYQFAVDTVSGASHTCPAITTVRAPDLLLLFAGTQSAPDAGETGTAAGMTFQLATFSTPRDNNAWCFSEALPAAGSTGTRTLIPSVASTGLTSLIAVASTPVVPTPPTDPISNSRGGGGSGISSGALGSSSSSAQGDAGAGVGDASALGGDLIPFLWRKPVLRYSRMKGFAPLPAGTLPIVFRTMREKCAFLQSIINVYARDPRIRHHAFTVFQEAGAPARDKAAQIGALTTHFQGYYYLPEEVETFAAPTFTIEHGYGDCDDTMVALGACLKSVGIEVAPELLGKRGPDGKVHWRHIYLRAFDGQRWVACETTRTLDPGVEPAWYVAAAERLRRELKGH